MIRFIYGTAGSGKSELVSSLIAEDIKNGQKAFLIVPEQEALSREREMVERLPGRAQLDFEVLNFSRLTNRVFRKFGGLSYNYIKDSTKALIMWRTVKELSPLLSEYGKGKQNDNGIVALMLKAVGELKSYLVTPTMLEDIAEKLPPDSTLKKKLEDISLVYAAYNEYLHEQYEDSGDDMAKLSKLLETEDFFGGYNVYIDSYSSFTAEERSVIFKIFKQADNVCITLGCDRPVGKLMHFESIYKTSLKLREGARKAGIEFSDTFLTDNFRANNEELKFLEKNLWNMTRTDKTNFAAECENIKISECATQFEMAECVAADILGKVHAGARYRDFAVIARTLSDYDGIVDSVFEKHGIPFFMSRKTDIDSFPLIKLIYTAFAIKNGNWRLSDVISYMRTGLCGISVRDSDIFESYASTWNICGSRYTSGDDWNMNPDGFVPNISDFGREVLRSVNETKKKLTEPLMHFFAKISGTGKSDKFNLALYEFLCELNIKQLLEEKTQKLLADGKNAEASETIQLWNAVIDALDTISEALPDTELDSEEYLQLLHIIFDGTDIGSIPTAKDEVVFGSADMFRADKPKYVYLIGMNDGEFPKSVSDNGIFTDGDKAKLEEFDIKLSGNSIDNSAEEMLFCYRAMCMPSDELTLVYSLTSSDKKAQRTSVALERVKALFPKIKIKKFCDSYGKEFIPSKEGALDYFFTTNDEIYKRALKEYFSEDEKYKDIVCTENFTDFKAGCSVSREDTEKIFGKSIRLSQTKIDSFVKCPFSYYANYVLGLRENKRADFEYNDVGTFVHEILENFMRETRDENGKLRTNLTEAEISTITDKLISAYIKKLCPTENYMSKRVQNLFIRLRRTVILLIKNLMAEFEQSEFSPALFEFKIDYSADSGLSPLVFTSDDGTKSFVVGKIDRVDTYKKDGKMYIRVVDYKTGTKTFSLDDVKRGLNIQLLLYLFTMWKTPSEKIKEQLCCKKEEEIVPAGILYSIVSPPDLSADSRGSEESVRADAEKEFTRNGLLLDDMEILRAMEKELGGRYIPVKLKKDNTVSASSSIATLETFGKLYDQICETVKKIASEMKSGKADATPLVKSDKGKKEVACRYCKMKPFCRSAVKTDTFGW